MLEFIKSPKSENVLFTYDIRDSEKKLVGHSKVLKDTNFIYPYPYILEIEIERVNKQDKDAYYHEALRQNLYKFINLCGYSNGQNTVLAVHLNNNVSRKALEIEKFKFTEDGFAVFKMQDLYARMSRQYATPNNKSISLLQTSQKKTKKNKASGDISRHDTKTSVIIKNTRELDFNRGLDFNKGFIISSAGVNGLLYTQLQKYLMSRGLEPTDNPQMKPLVLWIEMLENYRFDSQYFNTQSFIMNQLNDNKEIITNKANLYANFKKYYPRECSIFMAASWPLNKFIKDTKLIGMVMSMKKTYIIRPAGKGAFSGKDIYVVNTPRQIEQAYNKTRKYEQVLISEYITNPLLLDKRKFHLRIYFMVGLLGDFFVSKVFDFCKVFKAIKPYYTSRDDTLRDKASRGKIGDWSNKDIHDTHARGNPRDLFWPFDIPSNNTKLQHDYKTIYMPKICECLKLVSMFIKNRFARYTQSKNGYEIFGCDFLITDENRVILMEINDKVGYGCQTTDATMKLSKLYFDIIIKYILKPCLDSLDSLKDVSASALENRLSKLDWLVISKI